MTTANQQKCGEVCQYHQYALWPKCLHFEPFGRNCPLRAMGQTDIATTRLNRLWGWFSENCFLGWCVIFFFFSQFSFSSWDWHTFKVLSSNPRGVVTLSLNNLTSHFLARFQQIYRIFCLAAHQSYWQQKASPARQKDRWDPNFSFPLSYS